MQALDNQRTQNIKNRVQYSIMNEVKHEYLCVTLIEIKPILPFKCGIPTKNASPNMIFIGPMSLSNMIPGGWCDAPSMDFKV